MTKSSRKLRTYHIYILIALPIILFNLVVIFGLDDRSRNLSIGKGE
ncbi:MAG TPA: hypothetical protein VK469_00500 [Candidatus Kapabacteria bacterium]|nr:hypothetical protein [Candidatus Kapabacteria bacterium]